MNLAEHQATTKVRGGLAFREAPTVVRHCGASAGAHQKREFIMFQAQLDIVSIGRRDGKASSGPNGSDNVGPNNKVSVVEVQRFVQPK